MTCKAARMGGGMTGADRGVASRGRGSGVTALIGEWRDYACDAIGRGRD